MAFSFNRFFTNANLFKFKKNTFINNYNKEVHVINVLIRNFISKSHIRLNQKPNINIGTIGHIDHGKLLYINTNKIIN